MKTGFQRFRQDMSWAHTWLGLGFGFVLMVIFFFGSLSVFDREIDRWTMPETRFEPVPLPSFDQVLLPAFQAMQPGEHDRALARSQGVELPERFETVLSWRLYLTHRDPVYNLVAEYAVPGREGGGASIWASRTIDPRTGRFLPEHHLKVGTEFFYPLHYTLHLDGNYLGLLIVGVSTFFLLVILVSGVVVHRRFFREFFTFRVGGNTQRTVLDLHNLTGVAALPFHFFFGFTGIVIYAALYFPQGATQWHALHAAHEAQTQQVTGLPKAPAGTPAGLASVDAMIKTAQALWQSRGVPGEVGSIRIFWPGDAQGYVRIYRAGTDQVAPTSNGVYFNAASGTLLHQSPPNTFIESAHLFLSGLHLQHFRHGLLRWLYLLGGLAGCVCIATGFLFFVSKRKARHARSSPTAARVLEALSVTAVTGMLLSTLALMLASQVLPDAWAQRDVASRYSFWGCWVLSFLHALLRTTVGNRQISPAWRDQCLAIMVMALAAVLSNWVSTGDHLIRTLQAGYWPVAGIDLFLLGSAALALFAVIRLNRRRGKGGIA